MPTHFRARIFRAPDSLEELRKIVLEDAKAVFDLAHSKAPELFRQLRHFEGRAAAPKTENTSTISSPTVKEHETGFDTEKRADPLGDVVDGKLADSFDPPGRRSDCLVELFEASALAETNGQ